MVITECKTGSRIGSAVRLIVSIYRWDYSGLGVVIVTKDPLDGFTVEKAWGVPLNNSIRLLQPRMPLIVTSREKKVQLSCAFFRLNSQIQLHNADT